MKPSETLRMIDQMMKDGCSAEQIAEATGVRLSVVRSLVKPKAVVASISPKVVCTRLTRAERVAIRARRKEARRSERLAKRGPSRRCLAKYLPTPEEIEAACYEIRKSWTAVDYHSRQRGHLNDLENFSRAKSESVVA